MCLVKTVVAILNTSKTLDEAFISKGWIHIKTVILRNALLSTYSKNIKQLTYAGCQSEISFNFSQLLSILFESEVLLPICYQIFDDVLVWLSRCILQEAGILVRVSDWCDVWRVSDCEELSGSYSKEMM